MNKLQNFIDRLTTSPVAGLDIGRGALKVVELEVSGKKIFLKRALVKSVLPEENLAGSVKKLLGDSGIAAKGVAVGIASPEVTSRIFSFPPMPKKEWHQAIQLEAEQAILNGHTMAEMAIDWHLLGSSSGSLRGLLAVVPKTIIASRSKLVKEAGLDPLVVDVEGLALWNAYWTLVGSRSSKRGTVLLLNIGFSKTNLVIAKGPDELILARDLEIGAQGFASGRMKDWAEEIVDSLAYARSKSGMRTLDSVYATGGGSASPEILPLLKSAVTAPVTLWNPFDRLKCGSNRTFLNVPGSMFAVAIGLALRRLS